MNREFHRLDAVDRFKEIDPGIAVDLNDIVNLAAHICGAPVAIITLLGENTQWFKAAVGTDVKETPREMSFCNYTIEQNGVLIVPDLSSDERYNTNPLVTNDPNVRFYAGAPLTTKDGYGIGSLCVVDFHTRNLDEHQSNTLKVLSKQVINLMELNWSLDVLEKKSEENQRQKKIVEDSEIKLKAVFNSSADLHMLIGKNMEILAFNKAASDYVNNIHNQKVIVSEPVLKYIDHELKDDFIKYFAVALNGKLIKCELLLKANTELENWWEIKLAPVKNNDDEIIGVALNAVDITKRKQQEKHISIQNEALTRIAIVQSHGIRRPVASLLGIMDLMRLEKIDSGYFNMLELTVNELDEQIRRIIKDSENTIHTPHINNNLKQLLN